MDKGDMKKGIVFLIVGLALQLCPAERVRAAEFDDLKRQVDEQERALKNVGDKIRSLEKALAEAKKDGPGEFRAYWKEGLNFATEDGNFKLKIGGRVMNDWLWISEDDDIKASSIGEQEDGTEFRRARLCVSGLIYENVEFKVEYDFASGDADFKDVYLGLTDFPVGNLRMGHFKEPFSLEELTSANYITFLERALPNVFAPSRNVGAVLHNSEFDDHMTWAAGVFRDTDDYGTDVDDGGYNVTGRITALPIYEDKGASLLHVGAAYSHRNPDDSLRYRARPETHLTSSRFVDTSTLAADRADLLGLEAAWVHGPLSVQCEYVTADVDRRGTASDVDFDGYYVQASYWLTGEHRNYKTSEGAFSRVKPKENSSFNGGAGAWEATLRYSQLDLDDEDVTGGELEDITVGLNWHLNPSTRMMWNYVQADRDEIGQVDMLMMRLQVDF